MKKYLFAITIFSFAQQSFAQINTAATTTSATEITAANAAIPMPLELLSFDARASEGKSLLEWTVFNTAAIKNFVIEKSIDGRQWSKLSEMQASDETTRKTYEFTDNYTIKGANYYRLMIINPDGKASYTHVASVLQDGRNMAFYTYPNPATTQLTIVAPVAGMLKLTNAEGRVLMMKPMIQGDNFLDLQPYSSGSYWITYNHSNQIETMHISKQ